jgi:hypothetical protein
MVPLNIQNVNAIKYVYPKYIKKNGSKEIMKLGTFFEDTTRLKQRFFELRLIYGET